MGEAVVYPCLVMFYPPENQTQWPGRSYLMLAGELQLSRLACVGILRQVGFARLRRLYYSSSLWAQIPR
jgi:hypothetical protein